MKRHIVQFQGILLFCASLSTAFGQSSAKPAPATQSVIVLNSTAEPVPVQVLNPVQPPGAVTINNGPSQPIPAFDPAAPERAPIFAKLLSLSLTGLEGQVSFVQSTGKRAMIRHMSMRCTLPSPEEVAVTINGTFGLSPMFVALQSSFLKVDRALAITSMPVNLMIDSGAETTFLFQRSTQNINTPGTAKCEVFLIGYTVPQP